MARSRRKLSNVRLTAKYHTRYLGGWVLISAANLALLVALVYTMATQLHGGLVGALDSADVFESQLASALVVLALFATAAILSLAVLTSHRIAGPYLGLIRTCRQIAAGDFSHRLHFRKADRLEDVEEAFNEMLDALATAQRDQSSVADAEPPRLRVVGE